MSKVIYRTDNYDVIFTSLEELLCKKNQLSDNEFDFMLVNRDPNFDLHNNPYINIAATWNTDWVEVFGYKSEEIHDAIDIESVRAGRQKSVGDGVPMTAWHKNLHKDTDIAEHVLHGGLGLCSKRSLLIVGSDSDKEKLLQSIQKMRRKI